MTQAQSETAAHSYGALVEANGLSAAHRHVLDLVPRGSRVLDVGCAEGYLAAELAQRGCSVVGIEPDERAAAIARERGINVLEFDVEEVALDASAFDVVLFVDVLEHLRAPEPVLRQALQAGTAIVSVPNIAHWTARREFLNGRFPRADHGLFDRTHLRWFTRSSAHELASDAGFRVVEERFSDAPLPLESHVGALAKLRPAAVKARPELFALQVVLSLAPA
jgi:methionine biosynthesis protein MetW